MIDFSNGTSSVQDGDGTAMHSDIGPEAEARVVYLEPARLAARLSENEGEPLVLWDVGLGIAANALAGIECALALGARLRIESFEHRPEGLRLALGDPERFPWLARHAEKARALLADGTWSADGIEWHLHAGDFAATCARARDPDVVFYDFYAPAICPGLWGYEAFARLRPRMRERGVLCTYSCSTAVRSALLLAGFQVGRGQGTARKRETTLAAPARAGLADPLGADWLEKLRRSHRPLPSDAPDRAWERLHAACGVSQARGPC